MHSSILYVLSSHPLENTWNKTWCCNSLICAWRPVWLVGSIDTLRQFDLDTQFAFVPSIFVVSLWLISFLKIWKAVLMCIMLAGNPTQHGFQCGKPCTSLSNKFRFNVSQVIINPNLKFWNMDSPPHWSEASGFVSLMKATTCLSMISHSSVVKGGRSSFSPRNNINSS